MEYIASLGKLSRAARIEYMESGLPLITNHCAAREALEEELQKVSEHMIMECSMCRTGCTQSECIKPHAFFPSSQRIRDNNIYKLHGIRMVYCGTFLSKGLLKRILDYTILLIKCVDEIHLSRLYPPKVEQFFCVKCAVLLLRQEDIGHGLRRLGWTDTNIFYGSCDITGSQ